MKTYTAEEIATRVGVTRRAVSKRLDASYIAYELPNPSGVGRSVTMYKQTALDLWKCGDAPLLANGRKGRNDAGKARSRNQEVVDYLTDVAFAEFMENAVQDARLACRRALRRACGMVEKGVEFLREVEKCADREWLYKAWVGRSDKFFRGPLYTQNWRAKHDQKWRKLKFAMSNGHVRYSFWEMMENSYGACDGRGGARFIMLDDRKSDSWTKDGSQAGMQYAVYAWDLLTGALLWVEPSKTITANAYVRAILNTVNEHGCDMPIFFMENSRAAIAKSVGGLVRALYSEEDVEFLSRAPYAELFDDELGIVRNVPHIAHGFGKAKGERRFLYAKNWDASNFPKSYQGGNIHEGVQLQRKNAPVLGRYTPSTVQYFESLFGHTYTEYLDQERDSLRIWAECHGALPSYRAMMQFYTPAVKQYPDPHQTALLLYFASTEKHTVKITVGGSCRVTINHREYNLRHYALYAGELLGQKVEVIPVGDGSGRCVIYKPNKADGMPAVICVAEDMFATTAEEAKVYRHDSRAMRELNAKNLEQSTAETLSRINVEEGQFTEERLLAPGEKRFGTMPLLEEQTEQTETYEVVLTDEQLDDLINNSSDY